VVYSTCSMNPIENEAVVAAALTRFKHCLELEVILYGYIYYIRGIIYTYTYICIIYGILYTYTYILNILMCIIYIYIYIYIGHI
jgi:hypothetical protein